MTLAEYPHAAFTVPGAITIPTPELTAAPMLIAEAAMAACNCARVRVG